jgi:hypothetical protein
MLARRNIDYTTPRKLPCLDIKRIRLTKIYVQPGLIACIYMRGHAQCCVFIPSDMDPP